MNFTHIFQGFQQDFKLVFIVLCLGIISWKGASRYNGGGLFFRWGASFLSGWCGPWGASVLMGGGAVKKNCRMGDPPTPHYGKPCRDPPETAKVIAIDIWL